MTAAPGKMRRFGTSPERRWPVAPKDVRGNTVGDPHRRLPHRILRQMRVPGGCLHLRVTQKLSDHRQSFAKRQCPAGKEMSEVMSPHIGQFGSLRDSPPRMLKIGELRSPRRPEDGRRGGFSMLMVTVARGASLDQQPPLHSPGHLIAPRNSSIPTSSSCLGINLTEPFFSHLSHLFFMAPRAFLTSSLQSG